MKIKLIPPVKDVFITQPFGGSMKTTKKFYTALGLAGHNGEDYRLYIGTPIKACHDGIVTWSGEDRDGGISVTLCNKKKGLGYKTIYYHLSKTLVKIGDKIKAGDEIGKGGNTGKYTTGPHLHLGLKWIRDGKTINYSNGYKGAIDPALYMPKNYDQPHAFHRYYRKGSLLAEALVRFKNPWLHKQLKKRNKINLIYDNIFINKLTYGGWSFNESIDDAFHNMTAYLKKSEYKNGEKPFGKTRI